MADYDFTIPWAPSVNTYRAVVRNRLILSKKGREYKKLVSDCLGELSLKGEGLSDRLKISIKLNPPTKRKYDIDNYCKAILDSLTDCGFWLDDEQVESMSITKGEKIKGGCVDIKVWRL